MPDPRALDRLTPHAEAQQQGEAIVRKFLDELALRLKEEMQPILPTLLLEGWIDEAITSAFAHGQAVQRERLKDSVDDLCRWVRFVCRSLPKLSDDATRTAQDGLNYASQLKQALRTPDAPR